MIVGAAIVRDGRVLACARAEPPELAGGWEFPGGKVELGEEEGPALLREIEEELGIIVQIGERIGPDVRLSHGKAVLKIWLATVIEGEPQLLEHAEMRWLAAHELNTVSWLPADAPIVDALREYLPEHSTEQRP
ncbi:MAG: (deoxy)nucleoside triphosphate pyrophosphohydrolase [Longispora sp.]|nr:(deoxy)nucleoside triphosphate pyrophosphohydrolase [Longispora sp. (in: high G+C Gram-positive bacteria)]